MSASHEMVATSLKDIELLAAHYPEVTEVLLTNKRIVLRCPNAAIGMRLSDRIRNTGRMCEVKRGLKVPTNYYIQVGL